MKPKTKKMGKQAKNGAFSVKKNHTPKRSSLPQNIEQCPYCESAYERGRKDALEELMKDMKSSKSQKELYDIIYPNIKQAVDKARAEALDEAIQLARKHKDCKPKGFMCIEQHIDELQALKSKTEAIK